MSKIYDIATDAEDLGMHLDNLAGAAYIIGAHIEREHGAGNESRAVYALYEALKAYAGKISKTACDLYAASMDADAGRLA